MNTLPFINDVYDDVLSLSFDRSVFFFRSICSMLDCSFAMVLLLSRSIFFYGTKGDTDKRIESGERKL
jgi:hypothetical protein